MGRSDVKGERCGWKISAEWIGPAALGQNRRRRLFVCDVCRCCHAASERDRRHGLGCEVQGGPAARQVVLTLPVSAAYFVIGTFGSGGGSTLASVFYYCGYLLLAAVNAGVFRWIVRSARKRAPVPAGVPGTPPRQPAVRLRGVTPDARKLWWTVPLSVLLSLPQWMVASFAWCGISGCSGGGFGWPPGPNGSPSS